MSPKHNSGAKQSVGSQKDPNLPLKRGRSTAELERGVCADKEKVNGINLTPLKKRLESFEESDPLSPRIGPSQLQHGSTDSLPRLADLVVSERVSAPTSGLVSPRKPTEYQTLKDQATSIQDRITTNNINTDTHDANTDRGPVSGNQVLTFPNSKSSGSMKIGSNPNLHEQKPHPLGEKMHMLAQIVTPSAQPVLAMAGSSESSNPTAQMHSSRRFQKVGSGSSQLNHSFERVTRWLT